MMATGAPEAIQNRLKGKMNNGKYYRGKVRKGSISMNSKIGQ